MLSAIAQTSNTLLIGPIADKYSVWSSFRAAKPPQNNMKRGGKIIEAILYKQLTYNLLIHKPHLPTLCPTKLGGMTMNFGKKILNNEP